MARAPVGMAVLAALSAVSLSAAADEGETALSMGVGYASFAIPDHAPQGGALVLDYERGFGEELWFRASAQLAAYQTDEQAAYAGQSSLGLTYVIDVIKYVPYLHGGVGAVGIFGDPLERQLHPFVELGAGIDLLTSRERSYGLFTRMGSYLDDSSFVTVGARMTWRSGLFY